MLKNLIKTSLLLFFLSFSSKIFAAQSVVGQINGMMCIKCQKMVTEALQNASPKAEVKDSWPEGVAVSSFGDKSNLDEEEFKQTIVGSGFEVVKVIIVDKLINDAGKARKLLD